MPNERAVNGPLVLLVAVAAMSGCAVPVSTVDRPDSYYAAAIDAGTTEASLFAGDAATLSDEAIRAILAHRYEPPRQSRVALMPFGREIWSTWSEELALASEAMREEVIDRLRASPRIYDASYLPSILVPENRGVPQLREAAARYQADLLLVYRSYCRSFDRYRWFRRDEVRAHCGVEAVLLDTRTGLVPFTTVVTEAYDIVANDDDVNFQETRFRAQLDATARALGKASEEVVGFLATAD